MYLCMYVCMYTQKRLNQGQCTYLYKARINLTRWNSNSFKAITLAITL